MPIKEGYKQTEVGVIPEEWEYENLKSLCSYQNGRSLEHLFNNKEGYRVISIGNYSNDGKYIDNNTYIAFENKNLVSMYLLKKGDLAILLNDKTPYGTIIGRAILVEANNIYVFNQRTMCLTPKNILPMFLYYKINSDEVHNSIYKLSKPGTQIYVNTNDVLGQKISYPKKIKEQKAIATALSDMDSLIDSLSKLIEKKKNIKQGAMQELLTGKKRLDGFSGEWYEVVLGDLASFAKGLGLSKAEIANHGKYKCIHYGELFTDYKEFILNVNSRTFYEGKTVLSEKNDVLMPTSDVTPRGLATASCINEHGVIIGGDILIIKSINTLDGLFLSYVIRYDKKQVLQLVTGTTVYHLYASDMKKFKLLVPPTIEEQTAIATILSDMDLEIETLQAKLDKYKAIKQGMMQELLTGRIRLLEGA